MTLPASPPRRIGKKRTRRSELTSVVLVVAATAVTYATAAFSTTGGRRRHCSWQAEAFAIRYKSRACAFARDPTARQHHHLGNPPRTALCVLGSSKAHSSSSHDEDKKRAAAAAKRQQQGGEGGGGTGGGGTDDIADTAASINKLVVPNLEDLPSLEDLVVATQSFAEFLQQVLDEYTGGWALNYADLTPESPETAIGRGFLLTNLFYLVAGFLLTYQGDPTLGFFTDLAAIASFNYHYTQLRATSKKEGIKDLVRLSLFLDYMAASISILTAVVYVVSASIQLDPDQLSMVQQSVAVGMVGLFFLVLSWKYEYGRPYIIFHSLWHLGSAVSGYLIGAAHLQALQHGGPPP